jgi:hypothetical protein
LDAIVTRMKFDTQAESPKIVFAPVRWLTDAEYETAQNQANSKDAEKAVAVTPASADGVTTPAPLAIEGARPNAKTLGDLFDEDDTEAMAEVKAAKPKKAKATEVAAEEEPEVRKAAPKVESVPAKKNKLADIVADWDDE